ncbi:MAG TPA: fibronectin type III domain-containing protein [Caldilinea sp.]|mgnify:CR=1 FL=1|nr:fibronectin type III domain-containing protein [Caldilinea sp.]
MSKQEMQGSLSKCRRLLIVVALVVAMVPLWAAEPQPARAQGGTYYVDAAGGQDSPSCGGSSSSACKSIQAAVQQAKSGDTILVAGSSGGTVYTYPGSSSCESETGAPAVVCVFKKQLTIRGGYQAGSWASSDPAGNVTIIDGQGQYRGVFVLSYNEPTATGLTLDGFTVRNGYGSGIGKRPGDDALFGFGGGMFVEYAGSIVVRNVTFDSNTAKGGDRSSGYGGSGSGGAISFRQVNNAQLLNVRFVKNKALGGNGSGRGGYSLGGGVFTYGTTLYGNGLLFDGNQSIAGNASGNGIDGGQRGDGFGGAGSFQQGSTVLFENVIAKNNYARGGDAAENSGGAFGGAFKSEHATFTLRDAEVSFNTAQGGNARNGWLGFGGGIEGINATMELDRVRLVGNRAIGANGTSGDRGGAAGGAVNVNRSNGSSNVGRLTMTNCIVTDNSALIGGGTISPGGGGGALYGYNSTITVDHSTFARNTTNDTAYGSFIEVLEDSTEAGRPQMVATIRNSIVSDHAGTVGGILAILAGNGSEVRFENGLYFNNSGSTYGTVTGLNTMKSQDPDYKSPGSPDYDYHIGRNSGARDGSSSGLAVDIDGETRDSRADFGADEYSITEPLTYQTSSVTENSIFVSWQMDPDYQEDVIRYEIVHDDQGVVASGSDRVRVIDVGMNTSYTLSDLDKYSLHVITVNAITSDGGTLASTGSSAYLTTDTFLYLPAVKR